MFGEIQLCRFPFTSGASFKIRPALVLFDLGQGAIIARVTSVLGSRPRDVTVSDWQAANLLKSSIIRLDRLVTAEKTIFIRCLGALSSYDLETVRACWNRMMRL